MSIAKAISSPPPAELGDFSPVRLPKTEREAGCRRIPLLDERGSIAIQCGLGNRNGLGQSHLVDRVHIIVPILVQRHGAGDEFEHALVDIDADFPRWSG